MTIKKKSKMKGFLSHMLPLAVIVVPTLYSKLITKGKELSIYLIFPIQSIFWGNQITLVDGVKNSSLQKNSSFNKSQMKVGI